MFSFSQVKSRELWVASEFPKPSETYNNHLLKPVKLLKLTCLKLAKEYKRTLFHLPEVKKSD